MLVLFRYVQESKTELIRPCSCCSIACESCAAILSLSYTEIVLCRLGKSNAQHLRPRSYYSVPCERVRQRLLDYARAVPLRVRECAAILPLYHTKIVLCRLFSAYTLDVIVGLRERVVLLSCHCLTRRFSSAGCFPPTLWT